MRYIESVKGKTKDLYNFRYMFYSLVKKNLFGKYKNSALGFLWNFITPAITVLIFFIVFENFMGRDVPNYWIYLCSGMFPFYFINDNIVGGVYSITSSGEVIKKMHFPREIIPLSQVTYSLITFSIAYSIIIVLMIISGNSVSAISAFYILILIALMFVFSLGLVFILSPISVYSRDLGHLVVALSRMLIWITPTFYMVNSIEGTLSKIVWINPLTYFIEGFHKALYEGVAVDAILLVYCSIIAGVILAVGIIMFLMLEDGFAERV